jgi:hypothetical protein
LEGSSASGDKGKQVRKIIKVVGLSAEDVDYLGLEMGRQGFYPGATNSEFSSELATSPSSPRLDVEVNCEKKLDYDKCRLQSHETTDLKYESVTSSRYLCTRWDCSLHTKIPFPIPTSNHSSCDHLNECARSWIESLRLIGYCANKLLPMLASTRGSNPEDLVEICDAGDLGSCHHPVWFTYGSINSPKTLAPKKTRANHESSRKGAEQ